VIKMSCWDDLPHEMKYKILSESRYPTSLNNPDSMIRVLVNTFGYAFDEIPMFSMQLTWKERRLWAYFFNGPTTNNIPLKPLACRIKKDLTDIFCVKFKSHGHSFSFLSEKKLYYTRKPFHEINMLSWKGWRIIHNESYERQRIYDVDYTNRKFILKSNEYHVYCSEW
jgi:hypothetical protein